MILEQLHYEMKIESKVNQLETKVKELENLIEHLIHKRNFVEDEYTFSNPAVEEQKELIVFEDGKEYISKIKTIEYSHTFIHKESRNPINTYIVQLENTKGRYVLYRGVELQQPEVNDLFRHLVKDTLLLKVRFFNIQN
jgi:hypothetical protein